MGQGGQGKSSRLKFFSLEKETKIINWEQVYLHTTD